MRFLSTFLLIMTCFVAGGATCVPRQPVQAFAPSPQVLTATPTAADVAAAINRTASIRQLSTNSASVDVITMPALPKLNATVSMERDQRFRLQARLPLILGSGIDLGSNEQMFWFEVPEGVSKTLYYARHDQYRQQLTRAILPVDPSWVMDAMGLIQIDPANIVAGPVRRDDGRLEIRSRLPMPSGDYQRVCLLDPSAGFVTHQFLYSPNGSLVATSEAEKHQYYAEHNCSLPHLVKLHLQPASGPPLGMQIEVGSYAVNQLLSGDPAIFTMPQSASNAVDLTKLNPALPVGAAAVAPVEYTSDGRLGPMPLRGTVR